MGDAVVIGASAGGVSVLKQLVTSLPADFSLSTIVVQHIADTSDSSWTELLDRQSKVRVKEADEKEKIRPGTVYFAPANYHLLVERDRTFTLTIDQPVNYARPSIDVLFETAAEAYQSRLIGIVCTGSNFDGAKGLLYIKQRGGLTMVQDPETAEVPMMPKAAIEATQPDHVLPMEGIIHALIRINQQKTTRSTTPNS